MSNHWPRYVDHWAKVATPLRPHADDVRVYAEELDPLAPTLLLGVTPEIAALPLRGVAVDKNLEMIHRIWPHPAGWSALHAEWLHLPAPDTCMGQAVGDGALSSLRFPDEYVILFSELRRVLWRPSKIVLRLFAAPEQAETPGQVADAVWRGELRNFHALKWRLAMSLARAPAHYNIGVAALLALFERTFPDRERLLRHTGWPPELLQTIDIYRGSDIEFSFPTLSALQPLLRAQAARERYRYGSYELAERCPIVILEELVP